MKKYRDHYFNRAKQQNYPARSVYKLQEIDKKFRLLRPGLTVLDLGASPGSWSLFAAQKVGGEGKVVSIDLQPTETTFPTQVSFYVDDILQPSVELNEVLERVGPFDLVLSDMAPKTTGIKFTDQARSLELAEAALEVALLRLKPQGDFVVKIFQGPDVPEFQRGLRNHFKAVKTFKPKSSRAESKEIFFVGLERR